MVGDGQTIFHMCTRAEWRAAEAEGVYRGSSQDAADGFIHFSARDQVAVSAAKQTFLDRINSIRERGRIDQPNREPDHNSEVAQRGPQ